jgi:putative salt-induced outer membrane protein
MRSAGTSAIVALSIGLAALPARAEWHAKAELGASFASGNSENESVNGTMEVKNTLDDWTHTVGFAGNYGSDGSVTTAERWELRGQSDHTFNQKVYWFGAARYEDDRFSAFAYQASLSTGLGYKFIDTERTKFWVQGGPGYRFAEFRDDADSEDAGESDNGLILRGDLGFEHQLTETTKIVEKFLVESGSDNTYMQNDIGLEVTVTGSLGLRVGYQVRHNTTVLPGTEKTDTLTTVGLLYETK